MKPLISNIQRFSVHDGPGIRTTVFFKGCSLHCPWCANPENISFENEYYKLGQDTVSRGKYFDESTLYEKVTLDKTFYGKDGGVTFSGGEPLLSLKYYEKLLKRLKREAITIGVETALFVPKEILLNISQYIDFYYVDLKILTKEECKNVLGGELQIFLENLKWLHQNVTKEKITYRIPIVGGITNTMENLEKICKILEVYPPNQVEIFGVHNLAKRKYELLGRNIPHFSKIEKEDLKCVQRKFEMFTERVYIYEI